MMKNSITMVDSRLVDAIVSGLESSGISVDHWDIGRNKIFLRIPAIDSETDLIPAREAAERVKISLRCLVNPDIEVIYQVLER